MNLRFWVTPPRVRGTGKLQRLAYSHLRVLQAVPGTGKRRHVASCRLPPSPAEAATFLVLCQRRLLDFGTSTTMVEASMTSIRDRLALAAKRILDEEVLARKSVF